MLDLYHFSTVQNLLQQWNLSKENPSLFNTNLWINEIDNSQPSNSELPCWICIIFLQFKTYCNNGISAKKTHLFSIQTSESMRLITASFKSLLETVSSKSLTKFETGKWWYIYKEKAKTKTINKTTIWYLHSKPHHYFHMASVGTNQRHNRNCEATESNEHRCLKNCTCIAFRIEWFENLPG